MPSVFGHHVARKFYFVTVFPVFLLEIRWHRNSFCLNPFSHSVASEIILKCKKKIF